MKLLNYMRYDNNDYKVVMQQIAYCIYNRQLRCNILRTAVNWTLCRAVQWLRLNGFDNGMERGPHVRDANVKADSVNIMRMLAETLTGLGDCNGLARTA